MMTPEAQARQMALDEQREKVAEFMHKHGVTTGHGDSIEDLLSELGGWVERAKEPCGCCREKGPGGCADGCRCDVGGQ